MTRHIWFLTAFNGALITLIALHGNSIVAGSPSGASFTLEETPLQIEIESKPQTIAEHEAPRRRVRPHRRNQALLPVVMQQDISKVHQELADEVLRAIYPGCRNVLQNLYVRYDNPENRGLAGGTTIIVTGNVEADEFRGLLIHECGHLIDLTAMQGTVGAGPTSFMDGNVMMHADDPSVAFYTISWRTSDVRSRNSKDIDFVSGYATHDVFEDFAETFTYYMLQRGEFQARAQKNATLKAKLEWMQTYINTPAVGFGNPTDGSIPWDTTRVPYVWNGNLKVTRR